MNSLLRRSSLLFRPQTFLCQRPLCTEQPNPRLVRTKGQRDITTLDLVEERIRQNASKRVPTEQNWVYRSEMVNKLGLDNDHRNIWVAYGLIIVFGFTAFVYVKSTVVSSRKDEMEQREKIRKELNLTGADRKKIAIVESSV